MVTNKPTPLPVLQVVFCGTVQAGKSTTLNSLLGANVLPSSAKVCTSKITVLKKSIDNKYRVVMGGSTQEFNDVKELLKYLIGVVGAGGTGYNETTYSCTTIVISKLFYQIKQKIMWRNSICISRFPTLYFILV